MSDDRSEVWCDGYQRDGNPYAEQCETGGEGDVWDTWNEREGTTNQRRRDDLARGMRYHLNALRRLLNSPRWLGERLSYAITTARSEGLPDMNEAQWRALRAELVEYGERKGWAE